MEILHGNRRVASHLRLQRRGAYSEHMPASHKAHREWTPQRLLDWGERIDPHARQIVELQLTHKPHPEMGCRACLGLLLDRELAWRDYKRLVRLRKQAKLKYASVCL